MNQTFGCAEEADKRAEIHNLGNRAVIDFALLGFGNNTHNPLESGIAFLFLHGSDFDNTVIGDINFGMSLFDNLADNLAAGADDLADLVNRNLNRDNARRFVGNMRPGFGNSLGHFAQNMNTAFVSLRQSGLHNLFGNGRNFDIHLQSGNAVFGTGNFEVHIAEMVFITQNIGQNGDAAVIFLNQAHGNTGNRLGQRNAGSLQRHGRAADGSHRRRTVGFHNLGYDANRVREGVLVFGHHRMNGAPGQLAMTDFAAPRTAQTAAFADRERREVVVKHKVFFVFVHQTVDNLRVFAGAQRGNDQGLRLAAGKQSGTVRGRQYVNLTLNRADGFGVAAVNAMTGSQDFFADDLVHQLLDGIADITRFNLVFRINRSLDFFRSLADQRSAFELVGLFESLFKLGAELFFDPCVQSVVLGRELRSFPRLFASFFPEFVNQLDNALKVFKTEHNRAEHGFFGQFLRLGFNHQHAFGSTGDNQFQIGVFELFHGRVQNILAVFITDFGAGNRSHKRNTRNSQSGGSGNHGRNVGIAFLIMSQNGADNLNFVLKSVGKQRTDRPVNQTGDQNLALRGFALAFHKAAGQFAGCVIFFLIINCQRKEILIGLCFFCSAHRCDNLRFTIGYKDGTGGLSCDFSRFQY